MTHPGPIQQESALGDVVAGDWILLSDTASGPVPAGAVLSRGTLVAEVALPLVPGSLLLDHRHGTATAAALSLSVEPDGSLLVTHLRGGALMRHRLQAPLPRGEGIGRILFAWDAPARFWSLRFEIAGQPDRGEIATGATVMPPALGDLAALCAGKGGRLRHASVLWFGVGSGFGLPAPRPWLGLRSAVETPGGPVAAGQLRPGDRVLTLDRGPLRVRTLRPVTVPARGSLAPLLLRAPYFGLRADLHVGAGQLVLVQDVAVDYLFGEDRVLVEAVDLCDGIRALPDRRRATAQGVEIALEDEALLLVGGLVLPTSGPQRGEPGTGLRRLDRHEALALRSMMRARGRNIAA